MGQLRDCALASLSRCWSRNAHTRLLPQHLADELLADVMAQAAQSDAPQGSSRRLAALLAAERFRITRIELGALTVDEQLLVLLQPIAGQLREIVLSECVLSIDGIVKRSRSSAAGTRRVLGLCRSFQKLRALHVRPAQSDLRRSCEIEQFFGIVFAGCEICVAS